ncbi:adenosylcobinamide-phosphate synthase CbiB [Novosphingobium sp. JCM 18896]|uniref:adenosylcobinamide-phosphate synthase CbiB n=1 Tax=Novosphingobium sp. JCM 18896 TaxID=2989731 RepID=UPI0022235732|nr:adenosylcobinamide-phosphate synthase CbiB [Novosphingobium sp. JCM 18896]MCW1427481.1 adenosylcobinamide-phosphate synthase CbiB [Novosphingobium sp. JCM 18896]
MAEPVALVALALDAAIGWPTGLYRRIGHPVGLFARIIDHCEARWNRPESPERRRLLTGIATVLVLLLVAGLGGWLVQSLLLALLGPFGWIGLALAAFPALAQRSLFDHVRPVARALEAGDLPAARQAVGMIVGRDTAQLGEAGVARAAIESLAESFCDGVAAPLLWLLVGGLPGVWIYKAINTADSLIGHKEPRWRAFGWCAARTDDVLNLVPARIGGVMICLAGMDGWRTMWRDARLHASPNAGWTEAAMAGVLGLRLAGPIAYDGVMHDKPWIGDGSPQAGAHDICRALAVYVRACLLLWMTAGGVAWVL